MRCREWLGTEHGGQCAELAVEGGEFCRRHRDERDWFLANVLTAEHVKRRDRREAGRRG